MAAYSAKILRTLAAVVFASLLAPGMFVLMVSGVNLLTTGTGSQPPDDVITVLRNEIALVALASVIGALPSMAVGLLVGMPGVWMLRRLGWAHPLTYGVGGALAGFLTGVLFGNTSVDFEARDLALEQTVAFGLLGLTGVVCGTLVWFLAGTPNRANLPSD